MSSNPSYKEKEFKLDAESDDQLQDVQRWVMANPKIFTPLHNHVPSQMQGLFRPSFEITRDRTRVYMDTIDLDAFMAGIEIRQETREKGGIKQMVKINTLTGSDDAMMDRMEYPCVLNKFGVDFEEIEDKIVQKRLIKKFGGLKFKPLIAMISQRTRMKYNPEGNRDITIEAAFDYPCWGFAMNGFIWQAPEMELEIIDGPQEHAKALKLLEHEAARFNKFGLTRTITSKPTPGFIVLKQHLETEAGRKAAKALKPGQEWWMEPNLGAPPIIKGDFATVQGTSLIARPALAG